MSEQASNIIQFPTSRPPTTPESSPASGRPAAPHVARRVSRSAARPAEPLWRDAVGEELRARRVHRGERIADVADRAGVSPQYLSELERGRKDASSEMLSAVAGALGLPVPELARRASVRLARGGAARGPVCLAA